MKSQLFKNRLRMWTFLVEECGCDGLDLNRTIRLPMFWFAKKDGYEFRTGNIKDFAAEFNKEFNGNINIDHSYRYLKSCVLFFDDKDVVWKDENGNESVALVSEGCLEDEPTKVDWDWVNSLKSSTEDKGRFKKYAKDKFKISLKANQKLEGMIEDFKVSLEG